MKMRSKVKRVGLTEWQGMEEAVDAQLQTLRERRCPAVWISRLEQGVAPALALAARRYRSEAEWPLLAVIPMGCLSPLKRLLRLAFFDDFRTRTAMDEKQIFDYCETPQNPYWLFSVRLGLENVGVSPGVVADRATKRGRRALTVGEAVALNTHDSRVISRLAIWAGESAYKSVFETPTIFWCTSDGPWLGVGERDKGEPDFGTPTADGGAMLECCSRGRARVWKSM